MATPRQKKRKTEGDGGIRPRRHGAGIRRQEMNICGEENAYNARNTSTGKNCYQVRGGSHTCQPG